MNGYTFQTQATDRGKFHLTSCSCWFSLGTDRHFIVIGLSTLYPCMGNFDISNVTSGSKSLKIVCDTLGKEWLHEMPFAFRQWYFQLWTVCMEIGGISLIFCLIIWQYITKQLEYATKGHIATHTILFKTALCFSFLVVYLF